MTVGEAWEARIEFVAVKYGEHGRAYLEPRRAPNDRYVDAIFTGCGGSCGILLDAKIECRPISRDQYHMSYRQWSDLCRASESSEASDHRPLPSHGDSAEAGDVPSCPDRPGGGLKEKDLS